MYGASEPSIENSYVQLVYIWHGKKYMYKFILNAILTTGVITYI